jgi:predicted naringenin-chalcone synthase
VGSYGILGDAAGLVLVGAGNSRLNLLDTVIASNGALHGVDLSRDHSLLHAKYIIKGIAGLLARNGVQPGQVDHIVLQNANPMLYLHAIVEAGLDTNRIFTDNLGRYGHLNSLDVLVNLRQLLATGNAGPGSRVLVLGMGWAGTYTSSLLEVA